MRIHGKIQFQVGINILDGLKVVSESNINSVFIELILTSQLNRTAFELINKLQEKLSISFIDDKRFVFTKYLKALDIAKLSDVIQFDDSVESKISYDDFYYSAQINTERSDEPSLNILLFIAEHLFTHVQDNNIPSGNIIQLVLVFCIGEYNLMNHISNIKLLKYEKEEENVLPILNLKKDIELLLINTMYKNKNTWTCASCKCSSSSRAIHKIKDKFYCSGYCKSKDSL
jgi:hypothetical protein